MTLVGIIGALVMFYMRKRRLGAKSYRQVEIYMLFVIWKISFATILKFLISNYRRYIGFRILLETEIEDDRIEFC